MIYLEFTGEEKMNIEEQFNLIAKEYDLGRKKFIPCFDDYYGNTTDFLAQNIMKPKKVLDLGTGTGILSMFWYQHFPEADYKLVDIADEMLNVARNRFAGLENVSYEVLDYIKEFPEDKFDVIISALSIHHLEDEQKEDLFKKIYTELPTGGVFVNYDQFCWGSPEMNSWYDSFWENKLKNSELSKLDLELWQERRKLDKECSVEEEIKMLQESGFKIIKCVYSYQKFSVIVAIK